jgi:hypothetical protein
MERQPGDHPGKQIAPMAEQPQIFSKHYCPGTLRLAPGTSCQHDFPQFAGAVHTLYHYALVRKSQL